VLRKKTKRNCRRASRQVLSGHYQNSIMYSVIHVCSSPINSKNIYVGLIFLESVFYFVVESGFSFGTFIEITCMLL
jgi:hypothetical protein